MLARTQLHPTSDSALLERVAAGDVRALWELSARHATSLRALAFAILRDPVDAEQVVQSTFNEVRYEAGRFDPAHFPVFQWLAELTRVGALQRSRVRAATPSLLA
jgi:RNA polymerase sigma-70 factor (ECF subfamily)